MKTVSTFACLFILVVVAVTFSGCPIPVPGQTRTFDGMEFQWCPPGTFYMGSPLSEEGREPDENLHEVTISRGFWMGTYEVTQAQWVEVMGSNPSYSSNVGDDLPVNLVDWYDVQDFIDALNASHTDATYRLPTEAEWEYACRAGTMPRYYWGYDRYYTEIDKYCWYGASSGSMLRPVGGKRPNNWGLHDMSGSVLEWCQDWFGEYPTTPQTDPQGAESEFRKIIRGGSYLEPPIYCRSAGRYVAPPDDSDFSLIPYIMMGFRLVREADPCESGFATSHLLGLPLLNCLP